MTLAVAGRIQTISGLSLRREASPYGTHVNGVNLWKNLCFAKVLLYRHKLLPRENLLRHSLAGAEHAV